MKVKAPKRGRYYHNKAQIGILYFKHSTSSYQLNFIIRCNILTTIKINLNKVAYYFQLLNKIPKFGTRLSNLRLICNLL